MKKINLTCLSFGIFGLFFSSCLQEKNLYNPDNENQDDDKVGLFADFSLKTEISVIIHARDINGRGAEGVRFGVYTSEPCLNEDGKLENPAFVGYTNKAGQLEAKVVVPKNISRLYIIPLSAGYSAGDAEELPSYDIQDVITASFTAVPFPTASSRTRAAENDIYTITENISSNYKGLCILYKNTEVNYMGIPKTADAGGSALVSKATLSTDFTNKVNKLYPEKQNVTDADFSKNSDLKIVDTNGAEVWVTYIGDGGFYVNNWNVYNSLMYYNYTESELSSMDSSTPATLHMTMLLPNTNQRYCTTGLKVQLLYWDGNQYSKIFPEGTRIGFSVARKGYNGNKSLVTEGSAYNFKSTTYPSLSDVEGNYYSTPQLNKVGKSQAVTRRIDNYDYCVTGLDIRPIGDPQSDYDFNDVLIAISSNPVEAIQPGAVIDPVEEATSTESTYGTLAFEDLWPSQGDYDMNDFVVNYAYNLGKNETNGITQITLEFEPIAKGAAGSTQIGFGIELPKEIDKNNISAYTGATPEEDNNNVTFIVWDNVSDLSQFNGAFINTEKGKNKVTAEKQKVSIILKSPIELSTFNFNPFIFVGKRSHEVHLPDHKPTAKMDKDLLGTGVDRSDESKGIYYRMENMYSWSLDFPRKTKDSPAWRYPKEHSSVTSAYPRYADWINSKDYTWFEEKNANSDEIY
ncbi:LruC domain-containing protein [Phocaeicola sp.]